MANWQAGSAGTGLVAMSAQKAVASSRALVLEVGHGVTSAFHRPYQLPLVIVRLEYILNEDIQIGAEAEIGKRSDASVSDARRACKPCCCIFFIGIYLIGGRRDRHPRPDAG